jgi:hypothetical protein
VPSETGKIFPAVLNLAKLAYNFVNIVTWRLKAGIVEPEKTSITRQRLGKQVPAATDTQATAEELLEMMFPIRSVQSGYKEELSWESAVAFPSSKWAVSRVGLCKGGREDGAVSSGVGYQPEGNSVTTEAEESPVC